MNFTIVFAVILATAKFGQYLFWEWQTSPAILWPPTGIALAVIWLRGYKYSLPIFLGLFVATATGPTGHVIPSVVTTPLAQTLGIMLGVYFMRRLGFDDTFSSVRNVLIFIATIMIASLLPPLISTSISALKGSLVVPAYISYSRAAAAYIFSCLIITPFILSWIRKEPDLFPPRKVELVLVAVLHTLSVYFLFWTQLASQFAFLFFAMFFIAHFWICLRFSSRYVMLSVMATTVIGILGLFISPNPERELNQQLFASELFLFLVVPIFYAFSALVKERATTIKELHQALERIEKENVAKSEFVAVLAHELRNPLSPIKTTLEILELESTDPEIKQLTRSAHDQVHVMRRLLDDLLDITRVTQGKFELRVERVQLCGAIDRAIESTKMIVEERKHTIVVAPVCDDSIWLNVDPVRFEQVLVNLINNAAKYTAPEGRIEVAAMVKNGTLELRVKDNGQGIEQGHLEDVFQSFWQVKRSLDRTQGGGIGVGLSLTKHIVELHNGTIHAESEGTGKGSTFVIRLPRAVEPRHAAIERQQAGKPRTPNNHRVLVADDNMNAAQSLTKLLKLKGHEATVVFTGTDVLKTVPEFKPDVILLDIGLPDLSGFEVAAKLRENGFTDKIVALSGFGQKEDTEKAYKSGFDHHFIKPMAIARFEEYLIGIDAKSTAD